MERPIIFSAPMVRALLAGTKTQTRRVLKLVPPADADQVHTWFAPPHVPTEGIDNQWAESGLWAKKRGQTGYNRYVGALPYRPGDRLWVRENWQLHGRAADVCTVVYAASVNASWTEAHQQFPDELAGSMRPRPFQEAWRPSIHLPRWASRITLAVTDVRVERLRAISEADCWAEGVENCGEVDGGRSIPGHGRDLFRSLWNSINGPDAWDANPWVVAVSFNVESPAQRGAEG